MAAGERQQGNGAGNGERSHGLVFALLIAVPLWAFIGMAVVLLLFERPLDETESTVLMIAVVGEFILLRHYLRTAPAEGPDSVPRARPMPAMHQVVHTRRPALLRQTLTLSALVAAYLQYYFWDVQLQIAALHSVTVFVPVPLVV
jgi:hypothetical protein